MKDDDKGEDEALEPKAKTSKIVLILLGLNLIVSGLGAFKALTASPAQAATAEEETEESEVPGPLHAFDPFVVNLNDIEHARFLKVTIDVEVRDEEVIKALDASQTRFARDAVMRYLSSLKMADIMGEAAKDVIAEAIADRLNKTLGEKSVKRVLFVEFVVQ